MAAVAAASLAALLAGCGVPVAPGYQIKKEALAVHFVSHDSPHLTIHIEYTLANVGSTPLHFIDVALPSSAGFGSANFRAQINGREVALPSAIGSQTRIELPSEWRKKEKIALTFSYDLAAPPAADPRILVAPKMFLLNDSGWFPTLLPFKAFLAPQISRPNSIALAAIVPAGFRVTASGQPRGTKKQNGEIEYRFRIGKADFDPYILAGEYQEQKISADGEQIVIWTFQPISPGQALHTAATIAVTTKFNEQTFGPLPKSMKAIYDVELPSDAPAPTIWNGFLPGVVYNAVFATKNSLWTGLNNGLLDVFTPMELGYTWFTHMIRPRPEAWFLGVEFAIYSYAGLNKNQGTEASRTEGIRSAIDDYDNERTEAAEKPIVSLNLSDPEEQLTLGVHKMSLFFVALEDKCGRQNVTHAIAHMVYALRGGEYGYPEFRSALEQQCHQDLAEFFRTWLAQPGIPPDFRARYEKTVRQ